MFLLEEAKQLQQLILQNLKLEIIGINKMLFVTSKLKPINKIQMKKQF